MKNNWEDEIKKQYLANLEANKDKKGIEVKIKRPEDETYFTIIIYDYDITKGQDVANVHVLLGDNGFNDIPKKDLNIFIDILESSLNGVLRFYRQRLLNFLEDKKNG